MAYLFEESSVILINYFSKNEVLKFGYTVFVRISRDSKAGNQVQKKPRHGRGFLG